MLRALSSVTRATASLRISAASRSAPVFASRSAVSFSAQAAPAVLGRAFHFSAKSLAPAKDSGAPQKPKNAFMIFSTEKRAESKARDPAAQMTFVQLGELWREMTPAAKKKYDSQAASLKAAHVAEHGEPVKAVRAVKAKVAKVAKVPKKAPSAYALFVKEMFPSMKTANPTLQMVEITKLTSAKWKMLGAAEKNKYTALAATAKADFEASQDSKEE